MERNEILERISSICKDVFDDDSLTIDEGTTPSNVPGWDSLNHLNLINEIEDSFGVVFTLEESTNVKSVADLISVVQKHI